jgi:hypothetical protein
VRIAYGTLVSGPDADGTWTATLDGALAQVWVDPARSVAPWPVPAAGDRVAVAIERGSGVERRRALWIDNRGEPTYTYP